MSAHWVRKMTTYFNALDIDKDGFLSKDDFIKMSNCFTKNENASAERSKQLTDEFVNIWRLYMQAAGGENQKGLTRSILEDSIKQQMAAPELTKEFETILRNLFDIMHVKIPGYLQEDEHRRFFVNLGILDTSFAKQTFAALDTNHDGKLSFEDFLAGYVDFMFSQDENSPFKYFFGPLVA